MPHPPTTPVTANHYGDSSGLPSSTFASFRIRKFLASLSFILAIGFSAGDLWAQSPDRPNVILIMTDDQGWGDFGVQGNDVVATPNLDAMAERATRFSNFYVSPVCAPTRACLMTGRYNYRTRAIDTYLGRSMMEPEEVTIAEALRPAGYRTGIFGKWHLGDCYPMRPVDQGFDTSVVHLGGGLAQPSDPLENANRYTNPILFRNGEAFQADGYCTDVFFQNAMEFIQASVEDQQPFFAYIATNAPHGPFHDVPETLKADYLKNPEALDSISVGKTNNPERNRETLAAILAMITNVDQNIGRLYQQLDRLKIRDNTLVVFLTDNGPNTMRYVGDMRGMKSHVHEGGIRTPLWLDWPAGLRPDQDRTPLAAHIDILPTILEACQVAPPKDVKLDGRSLLPAARDSHINWPDRWIVIQSHRGDVPQAFHHFMIRQGDWKLLNSTGFGKQTLPENSDWQLYNLSQDPGEQQNLLEDQPDKAAALKLLYSDWFSDVSSTRPDNYAPPRIVLGSPHEPAPVLNRNEWRANDWSNQSVGHWEVAVETAGEYQFEVIFQQPLAAQAEVYLNVGRHTASAGGNGKSTLTLNLDLPAGPTSVQAWRTDPDQPEKKFGAYHLRVQRSHVSTTPSAK